MQKEFLIYHSFKRGSGCMNLLLLFLTNENSAKNLFSKMSVFAFRITELKRSNFKLNAVRKKSNYWRVRYYYYVLIR